MAQALVSARMLKKLTVGISFKSPLLQVERKRAIAFFMSKNEKNAFLWYNKTIRKNEDY